MSDWLGAFLIIAMIVLMCGTLVAICKRQKPEAIPDPEEPIDGREIIEALKED